MSKIAQIGLKHLLNKFLNSNYLQIPLDMLDASSDMESVNHRLKVILQLIYTLNYLLCLAERAETSVVLHFIFYISTPQFNCNPLYVNSRALRLFKALSLG